MTTKERIHSTWASEHEARKVANEVYAAGGLACVESVRAMALANDPLTPKTINPWCVIVKERTEEPNDDEGLDPIETSPLTEREPDL